MDYSIYFDDTQGLHTLVQKKDLISIMKRWELFDGVPVVNVTRNYTAPFTIEFSQVFIATIVNYNIKIYTH